MKEDCVVEVNKMMDDMKEEDTLLGEGAGYESVDLEDETRLEEAAVITDVDEPRKPALAGEHLAELEGLYFRSFGKKALLTREGEVVLGKRIEGGDRQVRRALRTVLTVTRGL